MSDQRNGTPPQRRTVQRAERQQAGVDGRAGARNAKDQRWPGTVMAIGLFVSLFTITWLGRRTLVDALVLLRWMALLCIVGTLLPYGWSGLRLGMEKLEWFLFNVVAVGPLTVSALLAANHFVHGPVQWGEASFGSDVTVQVEQGGVPETLRLPGRGLFFFSEGEMEASRSRRYRVGVAQGCLGYWSVTDVEVLP